MKLSKKNTWPIALLILLVITSCRRYDEPWVDDPNDDCPDCTVSNGGSGENGELTLYDVNGDAIAVAKEYDVSNDLKSFRDDKGKHNEMWRGVVALVPGGERQEVGQYEVFHGGGELLGYVYPRDNSLRDWVFGLDIYTAYPDGAFNADGEFVYTLIHEYAHIMTLKAGQLDPNVSENQCGNYHPGEGCASPNAYIGAYWSRFWKGYWGEFQQAQDDERALEAFYDKYTSHFVSDYAVTNPAEDIAESFTAFILRPNPGPGSTIADQKVGFFYDYPELVRLRDHMRAQSQYMPSGSSKMISGKVFKSRKHTCVRGHSI